MKYFVLFLILFSYILDSQCVYKLVWSDEFDGCALNTNAWNFDTGDQWYNNEMQAYSKNNVVVQNGTLLLVAKKENYLSKTFTSGRINSQLKRSFTYGRFEARMKFPTGKGFWPGFWLWPEDDSANSYREIDIMEAVGNYPKTIYSTCWMGSNDNPQMLSSEYVLSANYDKDYHIYSADWKPGQIDYAVDGVVFASCAKVNAPTGLWEFDVLKTAKFHIILNLAVGGDWPGTPSSTTVFPSSMYVDYVRVYQDDAVTGSFAKTVLMDIKVNSCEEDYTNNHLKNGVRYLKNVGKVVTSPIDNLEVETNSECCDKCGNTDKCVAFKFISGKCSLLSQA